MCIFESTEPVLFTETNAKSHKSNGQVWGSLECLPGALLSLTEVYTIRPSNRLWRNWPGSSRTHSWLSKQPKGLGLWTNTVKKPFGRTEKGKSPSQGGTGHWRSMVERPRTRVMFSSQSRNSLLFSSHRKSSAGVILTLGRDKSYEFDQRPTFPERFFCISKLTSGHTL